MADEVSAKLRVKLTLDQLAEIEAMFYLGRDLLFPEYYEEFVSHVRREYSDEKSLAKISHLMEKTNFRDCLRSPTAERNTEQPTIHGPDHI
jgi:hypothetical protein